MRVVRFWNKRLACAVETEEPISSFRWPWSGWHPGSWELELKPRAFLQLSHFILVQGVNIESHSNESWWKDRSDTCEKVVLNPQHYTINLSESSVGSLEFLFSSWSLYSNFSDIQNSWHGRVMVEFRQVKKITVLVCCSLFFY